MVDTSRLISPNSQLLPSFTQQLQQLAQQSLTSQRLVQLAEEFYWLLIEGEYRDDLSPQANQLRSLLSDITSQWESLLGNLHEQPDKHFNHAPEFPPEWICQWLEQIQAIEVKPMPEVSKNQPTFHIGQVGQINSGDVTIQGDQIGIQHNYAPEQDLAEAASKIRELLQQVYPDYATATDSQKSAVVAQKVDQQKPEVRAKIVGALEKGGKKALEKLVDHPAAAIAIAAYEGWKESKK